VKFCCSIVIPTYNRRRLVARAIESALSQEWPEAEIVVIDDGSTDGTSSLIADSYPQVRYLCQDVNRGCGAARNRGLREASRPWVVFLEDDDTLLPGSLALIASRIAALPGAELYPVFQFPRSNGRTQGPFKVLTMADYFNGTLLGDFVPVIRREYFLAEGLAYPECHSGADGLLWWRVADKYGLPTWADVVQTSGNDSPHRMLSTRFHLRHARDHAQVDERILAEFGETLAVKFPQCYEKRCWSAATYRMLGGDRVLARSHIRVALQHRVSPEALGLWAVSFMPEAAVRTFYALYKKAANGWKIEM